MTPTKTRKTNCFTPVELRKLPVELQPLGEELWTVFHVFELMSKSILEQLGCTRSGTYSNFLKKELNPLIDSTGSESEKATCYKTHWQHESLNLVLRAIDEGHKELEAAYSYLLSGNVRCYATCLVDAGVHLGRLATTHWMNEDGIYHRIGSIGNALHGASKGGIQSGVTRKQQSRIPTPGNLRVAHLKLVDSGKPQREIPAMLARKYDCTTDHIRKILKRD